MILDKSLIDKNLILSECFQIQEGVPDKNYRVGEIIYDGQPRILVLNVKTSELMEYFFDDSPSQWISLSIIDSRFQKDDYYINRQTLQIRGARGILSFGKTHYPRITLHSKISKSITYKIHVLIGKLFIPNSKPKERTTIDHIDRDTTNYALSNLRWASFKEQRKNQRTFNIETEYVSYFDKGLSNVDRIYSHEDFVKAFVNLKDRIRISGAVLNNTKCFDRFWMSRNPKTARYLASFGILNIPNLSTLEWREHYSGKLLVHPLGLYLPKGRKLHERNITPGRINDKGSYDCTIRAFNKKTHTIIAEVFLNDNKPLPCGFEVDHINTNPLDNRVENLRICKNRAENMQNKITRDKLCKKVVGPDGTIYGSQKECAEALNIDKNTIKRWIENPNKNFNYLKG